MSSKVEPRKTDADRSPIAQRKPSTILDLPHPFGPTTALISGSKRMVVGSANDLNPANRMLFKSKSGNPLSVKLLAKAVFYDGL